MKLHDWYECKKCDKFHPLESDTIIKVMMNKSHSNSLEFFQYVSTYSRVRSESEIQAADDQFNAIFDQRLLIEQAADSRSGADLQSQRFLSEMMHCVGRAIGLNDKEEMISFKFLDKKKVLKFKLVIILERCV